MPKASKPAQAFETEPRPEIALQPVESSKIKAIGYDPESKTLAVQFNYGAAVYHYPDVAPETHAAFVGNESVGKFFGVHIQELPFKKYHAEPEAAAV